MKIAFLGPANSIHTVRWVNSLSKRGHEIHLFFLSNHKAKLDRISEEVICHELKVSGMKGYYLNAKSLRKEVALINPDVINVHYASGYGTLARVARLNNVLLSVWGSDVYIFPYESKLKSIIIKKNLEHAECIASTSNVMMRQTKKLLASEKVFFVTPFGIDIEKFYSKEQYNSNDNIQIVCVKTLEKNYGIDVLVHSVRILIDNLTKSGAKDIADRIICRIYGDGEEKDGIQALVDELELGQKVFLEGKVEHERVPAIMRQSDIFCCLSRSESFGVSAIEASSAGLPVVVSDAEGFTEVVEHNVTGIIVNRDNPFNAADALERLVRDDLLQKTMGEAGRRRVEVEYDWDVCVDKMIHAYEYMISNRK